MKTINLGLIGCGTIGSGVIKSILKNKELIKNRRGFELNFKYVCDIDFSKISDISIDDSIKTSDWKKVVEDKDIDIVIELVGGIDLPYQIITKAINNKKHIVTANKSLIATYGEDIFSLSSTNRINIGFEASVAGGIPIIRVIKEALVGDKITAIYGIINGTSNYILTKMIDEKMSFEKALKIAQKLGFAEKDPTLDINGGDAGAKISILSSLAFNTFIKYNEVYTEGIDKIDLLDIEYALQMGYVIKLLAITSIDNNNEIEIRVNPSLVPIKNSLASIKNEFNAILIESELLGTSMYYGKGAGSLPTASAVISDIVSISEHITNNSSYSHYKDIPYQKRKIKDINELISRYYLRINTEDKPGVLAKVAGILASHNISIAEVHQKETKKEIVPVVIITHEAKEKNFRLCLEEINKLSFIKKQSIFLRLID